MLVLPTKRHGIQVTNKARAAFIVNRVVGGSVSCYSGMTDSVASSGMVYGSAPNAETLLLKQWPLSKNSGCPRMAGKCGKVEFHDLVVIGTAWRLIPASF